MIPAIVQPDSEAATDLNLAGPNWSFVERNIENEILNSSTDNSSIHDDSAGEESDNGLM